MLHGSIERGWPSNSIVWEGAPRLGSSGPSTGPTKRVLLKKKLLYVLQPHAGPGGGGGVEEVVDISEVEERIIFLMGGESFASGDRHLAIDPFSEPHQNEELLPSSASAPLRLGEVATDTTVTKFSEATVIPYHIDLKTFGSDKEEKHRIYKVLHKVSELQESLRREDENEISVHKDLFIFKGFRHIWSDIDDSELRRVNKATAKAAAKATTKAAAKATTKAAAKATTKAAAKATTKAAAKAATKAAGATTKKAAAATTKGTSKPGAATAKKAAAATAKGTLKPGAATTKKAAAATTKGTSKPGAATAKKAVAATTKGTSKPGAATAKKAAAATTKGTSKPGAATAKKAAAATTKGTSKPGAATTKKAAAATTKGTSKPGAATTKPPASLAKLKGNSSNRTVGRISFFCPFFGLMTMNAFID